MKSVNAAPEGQEFEGVPVEKIERALTVMMTQKLRQLDDGEEPRWLPEVGARK